MKVACSACNVGTYFIKMVSYETDKIPHDKMWYKCTKCDCIHDFDELVEMINDCYRRERQTEESQGGSK